MPISELFMKVTSVSIPAHMVYHFPTHWLCGVGSPEEQAGAS